jgi:predicted O-methyltransferase YrrM
VGILYRTALCRAAARKLSRELPAVASLDEAIDYAFGFHIDDLNISPVQKRSEITELLHLGRQRGPLRTIVEIGTDTGGTLFLLTRAAEPDAIIATVDIRRPERALVCRAFARDQQHVRLIHGDSHQEKTQRRVERLFAHRDLDLLFIDGDHSYNGVRRDFELYSPLVKKGGMIAIHDIAPGPELAVGGVPLFWRELKEAHHSSIELVEDWQQGGFGIGVIFR